MLLLVDDQAEQLGFAHGGGDHGAGLLLAFGQIAGFVEFESEAFEGDVDLLCAAFLQFGEPV